MDERMWTYPELKFITINQHKLDSNALASQVNSKFHEGRDIRSAREIEKIKNARTILNKDEPR